ncbi:MAG: hypothetical protein HY319_20780 [Armatimonadetes bacterium]|nr:hypothetical protein [Armatimonadota bacterium]
MSLLRILLVCFLGTIPAASLPAHFEVRERAGVDRHQGWVLAGVPLARGEAREPLELAVRLGDRALPARFEPLAYWPDGSVRWARSLFPLSLGAGETRCLTLEKERGPVYEFPAPALPPFQVEILADPPGAAHRIEIQPLGPDMVQVTIEARQPEVDGVWSSLRLRFDRPLRPGSVPGAATCGDWGLAVQRARERGPVEVSGPLLELYPRRLGPFPADRGFRTSHVLLFRRGADPDALSRELELPLRACWDPEYLDATGAMGRTGGPSPLDASFRSSWERLRQLQALPQNRGWTVWGDFIDGAHGLAYAGYLAQEYDPASCLFLFHARTGDPDALDAAVDMARQYADASVSPDGGNFEHRATLQAVETQIASAAAGRLLSSWRHDTGGEPTRIRRWLEKRYGPKTARAVQPLHNELEMARHLGYLMVVAARRNLRQEPPTLRNYAEALIGAEPLRELDLPTAEIFVPFFDRYGGSWDDFPRFHFCNVPVESERHRAGHSLVEMLVWGHLTTGDPGLRRTALQVARYHVEQLVPRTIEHLEGSVREGRPVPARELGWPLLNLTLVRILTQRSEPELDRKLSEACHRLVGVLGRIPPEKFEGSIHAGVAMEALARYHEATGDPEALAVLVRLARYWSSTQWNSHSGGFAYLQGEVGAGDPAWPVLTGLCSYGIAYAAQYESDPRLSRRARDCLRIVEQNPQGYPKSFAMLFRNSQRAARCLDVELAADEVSRQLGSLAGWLLERSSARDLTAMPLN